MDSTALGLLLRRDGEHLQPVYCCHRPNGGNVTRKELAAAAELADWVWGTQLLILYWPKKGAPPQWLSEYGDVEEAKALPVASADKDHRNRRMLRALDEHDLAGGTVGVGVFGTSDEPGRTAERKRDTDPATLDAEVSGEVVTPTDLGLTSKADLLRAVGRRGAAPAQLAATESCLMWFAKHCGNCWSCVDRAEAFVGAWGHDPTPYRRGTSAWKIARS